MSFLVVDTRLTPATGAAEREAALDMVPAIPVRRSAGRVRKCIEEVGIEEVFGWSKATAGFRKTRHCGLARVNWMFTLTITAHNLVRLPRLMAVVA